MSLDVLRSRPADACSVNVYRTAPASGSFTGSGAMVQGGKCTISCSQVATGFFNLTATATTGASNDYFYPWMQRGIGWVQVPKTVPDGSIVMTGGVNGCTLVVSESGGSYYFYHDGDSKYLNASQITGTVVATVQPKDYDPLGWGQKMFEQKLQDLAKKKIMPKGDVSYGHFVVAVKSKGRFGMYSTGLMSLNGLEKLPFMVTPCIVTFD